MRVVISKVLLAIYVFLLTAERNAWFSIALWVWTVLGIVLAAVLLIEALTLDEVVYRRFRRGHTDTVA